jgi:hypothetical protein
MTTPEVLRCGDDYRWITESASRAVDMHREYLSEESTEHY